MTLRRNAPRSEERGAPPAADGPDRAGDGRLLTLQEAAQATGRNAELLRRWCVSGRIRAQRFGRDWLLTPDELTHIEHMPRRGARIPAELEVGDRRLLNDGVNEAIDGCLEPGEQVRVVVPGTEDSAIVATERRMFVVRDGDLVHAGRNAPAEWPLDRLSLVQLEAGTASGALVVTGREPHDRALVLVLARPHLDRARAAADVLRGLLMGAARA